ncbi:MAG: THxN family PEP-CTERM protein [Rhodocyclaceae bacterium]|nr:THxN family PEP-CTERM protein [Rhodocyclaceae bacterium]
MKTKFKMLLAAATIAVSGFAHAVPVNEFFFSQNAGWLNPITDGDGATYVNPIAFASPFPFTLSMENPSGPLAPANTFDGMRWTDTGGVSSAIHVNTYNNTSSFSSGNMLLGDTDGNGQWNAGEYWAISTLTQENRIITGNFPDPLWVANISANLRIFGDAGHTINAFTDPNHNTLIRFWETLNTQEPGVCASPAPMGSRCDDIYTITLLSLAQQSFPYNGNWYTLTYALFPGNDVLICTSASDPGCDAASAPAPGQIAVYTREGSDSTIHVAMAWQVPEPSMLSLMGLALVGLGFISRRRQTM